MADEQKWITQQELVAELESLIQDRQTGTLFCATAQGNSATLTFQEGDIKGLGFRTTFGVEALPLMAKIANCRLNFRPNVILRTDDDLPDNAHILAALTGKPISPAPAPAEAATTPLPNEADSRPALDIDMKRLKKVTAREATDLIGPVGALLTEEYFANITHFTDYNEIRNLLTALISETGSTERTGQLIYRVFKKSGLDPREQRD